MNTETVPRTTTPTIVSGTMSRAAQPELVGDDVILRPWRDEDAANLVSVYRDRETRRWHARTVDDADEALALIRGWRDGWALETEASWAVGDGGQTLLGRMAIKHLDLDDGAGEVAYWTAPWARGAGVASRALEVVVRWAFDDVGLHRLQLEHSTGNPASCRVARRTGFAVEGTRRSAALHADGWHDMHLHARISQTDPRS